MDGNYVLRLGSVPVTWSSLDDALIYRRFIFETRSGGGVLPLTAYNPHYSEVVYRIVNRPYTTIGSVRLYIG